VRIQNVMIPTSKRNDGAEVNSGLQGGRRKTEWGRAQMVIPRQRGTGLLLSGLLLVVELGRDS